MYPRTLIFTAMDTTSGALARILSLLSIHQDVQDKLRQEITEARKSGDLSYDELVALPYLEAVCRETLRVYAYHPFYYFPAKQELKTRYPPLSIVSRT
jgi:cytochrome P450